MKLSTGSVEPWVAEGPHPQTRELNKKISRRAQWAGYIFSLIVGDVIITGLAFRLAFWVRFESGLILFNQNVTPVFDFYQTLSLILLPVWIGIFAISGLYQTDNLLGGTKEYSLVFQATLLGMLVVIIVGFLDPFFVFARGWLVAVWGLTFFLTVLTRFVLRRVVYKLRSRGFFLTPAVIIGGNDEGQVLGEQLLTWNRSGMYVIGFIDDTLPVGHKIVPKLHVLGSLEALDEIVKAYGVEEIVIATSALSREKMLEVFKKYGVSESVRLRLSSGLFEIITTGLQVKEVAYVPMVFVNKVRLTGLNEFMKMVVDYGLTIPGLILLSPVLLVLTALIKLDSSGPVIYRRRVMGLNGVEFDAFKFRTMKVNGEQILSQHPELRDQLHKDYKLKNDPRVTRAGRFLRKYSLDELPQLFNVLRREMSLVGPRMISPPEMDNYGQWGINLLTVRPGLTGIWQVSGRSDVSYETRVRLDMHYIRNWSIWLDLHLLFRTIPVVLKGEGAY